MATVNEITTAAQLWDATDLGRCELVRGELIQMAPTSLDHGDIELNIGAALKVFVRQHNLGKVVSGDVGFRIVRDPDTVRAPDVAFVRGVRVPPRGKRGFVEGAPDLAVEVLSPDDRPGEVLAKVTDWFDGGCQVVWVVDPATETLFVHRAGGTLQRLTIADTLTEPELLPGFALPVAEVFAE